MSLRIRDDYARAWDRERQIRRRERMTPQAKAERRAKLREQERVRKRQLTEEQKAKRRENERRRTATEEQKARRRENERRRAKERRAAERAAYDIRPFVGCDGEGITLPDGQSEYRLFRVGERELHTGSRLTTPELLRFIADHPDPEEILVWFAGDYDTSNILRDVSRERTHPDQPSRFERIFIPEASYRENKQAGEPRGWTWLTYDYPDGSIQEFGVDYLPRNFLKVCRSILVRVTADEQIALLKKDGIDITGRTFADKVFRRAEPGSVRTIYDTFGFFQSSFVSALERWQIGTSAQRLAIQNEKDRRDSFAEITPEIRAYCAEECNLLASLMQAFRAACLEAGIRPRTWNGAGKLATAMLADHDAMTRKRSEELIPAAVLDMAMRAYYGGRFEVTRVGKVYGSRGSVLGDRELRARVYERDINSAYPAAMLTLPCLEHGTWLKVPAETMNQELALSPKDGPLYVCPVEFSHPRDQFLCGLPFRSKAGSLSWPRHGRGVYWSTEIRSAQRLGATVKATGSGYVFQSGCECRPWAWVADVYAERLKLGKATKGIPLKLGSNSLYGKQAQRVGAATYANPINAGLITAHVRAQQNDAIASLADPRNCLMIATDALYTIGEAPDVPIGADLGQWEAHDYAGMFIVRPGLYWPLPRKKGWKPKTRGISRKFFEPHVPQIARAWKRFSEAPGWLQLSPSLPIKVRTFIGLRYAWRLNDFALACQWVDRELQLSFGDRGDGKPDGMKRGAAEWSPDGQSLILESKPGSPGQHSVTYDRDGTRAEWSDDFEDARIMLEAMPDPVDLTPPFDRE